MEPFASMSVYTPVRLFDSLAKMLSEGVSPFGWSIIKEQPAL